MGTGSGRPAESDADRRPHPRPSSTERAAPVLALFLLSPLIGEIVGAALRFSYFTQPPRVAAILCFYGAGAVLIREAVRRSGLNGWGLVLLAFAFAVLEEGLGLQTIFNPRGMDGETVYGRAFEVNWLWAVTVTGYHAVWSIVIPITVAHLLFPARRHAAWLSRRMLGVFAGVFAAGFATFVFISLVRSDFRLSVAQIAGGVLAVAVLVLSATACRRPWATTSARRSPGPPAAGVFGFGAGLAWLTLYLVAFIGTGTSFWIWTLAALVFGATVALILRRWAARPDWRERGQLPACSGATLALWLFGLLLVANGGRADDVVFHFVVLTALLAGYLWLRRRIPSASATAAALS